MRIAGVRPAFVRPPYGNYNDLVRQVAAARGQHVVNWDLDAGDAVGNTPEQSQAVYDDAIRRHPPTILALNHETYGACSLFSQIELCLISQYVRPFSFLFLFLGRTQKQLPTSFCRMRSES